MLEEEVASRLEEMLQGVAEEHGRKMGPLAIKCNRVHFSLQANARRAPRQFIYRFEGTSAHVLFSEFEHTSRLSSLQDHLFRTIFSGPSLPRRHDRGGRQAGNKQHIEDQSQMNEAMVRAG